LLERSFGFFRNRERRFSNTEFLKILASFRPFVVFVFHNPDDTRMKRELRTKSLLGGRGSVTEIPKNHLPSDPHANSRCKIEGHCYLDFDRPIAFDVTDKLLEQHAEERKKDKHDSNVQLAWTIITCLLVLIYTGTAVWQGFSNQKAASAANIAAETGKRQAADFEAVEAAVISVEFSPTVKIGKSGQGLIVDGTIDVTNIGQTTAVNFTAMGSQWVRNLAPPKPGIPGLVNANGNITPFNVGRILLGSGKTQHFPVGFQVFQIDEIRKNTWQSGITLDFSYNDVFGKQYSGRDCFMINPNNVNEFVRCPQNQFR
jgi:hypothetical protein